MTWSRWPCWSLVGGRGAPAVAALAACHALPALDEATSAAALSWVREGWLTLADGAVIDYRDLCAQIAETVKPYKVREIAYDKWSGEFTRQELERLLGRRIALAAAWTPGRPTCTPSTTGGGSGPVAACHRVRDGSGRSRANPSA